MLTTVTNTYVTAGGTITELAPGADAATGRLAEKPPASG